MTNTFDITESLQQLTGQNAWGLRRSHGSMFLFDVGKPVPAISRRTRGEYGFLFESCEWLFASREGQQRVSSSDDKRSIETAFELMQLGKIEEAAFSEGSGTLSISFDSGLQLTVSSDAQEEDSEAMEWMLFIPNQLVWTKTRSTLTCKSSHTS